MLRDLFTDQYSPKNNVQNTSRNYKNTSKEEREERRLKTFRKMLNYFLSSFLVKYSVYLTQDCHFFSSRITRFHYLQDLSSLFIAKKCNVLYMNTYMLESFIHKREGIYFYCLVDLRYL